MNPYEYSVASLRGHGLRGEDYIRSFATFIKRLFINIEFDSLPSNTVEIAASFDSIQIPELYYTIYATMYPNLKLAIVDMP